MSRSDSPHWYQPGDIVATVREASRTSSASTQTIVDVLAREELDAPRNRILEIVETARDRVSSPDDTPKHDLDDPRPLHPRFVDVGDLSYLETRDFATVLGVVLSRYEGTFRTPDPVDDVAVDLFWNRQHTTVAFRTIPRPVDARIGKGDVEVVVDGETAPSTGRSPSTLGVVSNVGFSESARDYAEQHDIRLFGTDHVSRWFDDAHLTHEVFGTILTGGEHGPAELSEIVDPLPPLPAAVRGGDPLSDPPEDVWSGTDEGHAPQPTLKRSEPVPVADQRSSGGEKGTLYADPSDDGDYDAFDRFMNELQENDE